MTTLFSGQPDYIPRDGEIVGGYINGDYKWEKYDWDKFPVARWVTIQVYIPNQLVFDAGVVLEINDVRPKARDAAEWWVEHRMRAGLRPCIHTHRNMREFLSFEGVDYWLDDYTNEAHLLPGSVATKWNTSPFGYDISLTDGVWPPVKVPGRAKRKT